MSNDNKPRDLFTDGFTAADFECCEGYEESSVSAATMAEEANAILREALASAQVVSGTADEVNGIIAEWHDPLFPNPYHTHTARLVAVKKIEG